MADFSLNMHPASEGDAATLSWGPAADRRHALVDMGRTRDYRRLKPMLAATGRFELFVITHIDADHIAGAMPMLREASPPFTAAQVWFNAYHHLIEARDSGRQPSRYEIFSPAQGEKLSEGIIRFGWRDRWNAVFDGGRVSVDAAAGAQPIRLAGGMTIHLLSPDDAKLRALEPEWLHALTEDGLRPFDPDSDGEDVPGRELFGLLDVEALARERYEEDAAAPNGSSIAFIAEYGGKRVLMPGDAHPGVLAASLRRLGASPERPMRIDCFKVSHHGSKANTSPELLSLVDCHRYAISTDGTKNSHPNAEAIARILKAQEARRAADPSRPLTELIFNFRQPFAEAWDAPRLKNRYHYVCSMPSPDAPGVEIAI